MGTSMVACIAARHQKPVVAFSETYKFTDKVNLDPINNNEIGDPLKLLQSTLNNGAKDKITDMPKNSPFTLLNLKYDLTPSQNISMVSLSSVSSLDHL